MGHIGDIAPNQDWLVVKNETNSESPAWHQVIQSKEPYTIFLELVAKLFGFLP